MKLRNVALVSTVVVLGACGGGGGSSSSSTPKQGAFVDAPVQGASYQCGAVYTGVTDASGGFRYVDGGTCTFSIGGITLGTGTASANVTPVDLVSGATDETNTTVSNLTRFLLSLDTGGNTSTRIVVSDATKTALSNDALDFSSGTFASTAQTLLTNRLGAVTLVSAATAQNHLRANLFALMAGTYNCTFSGGDSGSGTATLTAPSGAGTTGTVTGSGTSSQGGGGTLSGTFTSSGSASFTMGSVSSGATFTGTVTTRGTASGSWSNTSAGVSGSWRCTKA